MDRAYDRWQKAHWSQENFWAQLSPREKVAVYVGNLNNQVCNGGFSQWVFNGYSDCSEELLQILPLLGDTSREVARLIGDVLDEENQHLWSDDDDGDDWDYSKDYDRLFYSINEKMLEECEMFVSLPTEEFKKRVRDVRLVMSSSVLVDLFAEG